MAWIMSHKPLATFFTTVLVLCTSYVVMGDDPYCTPQKPTGAQPKMPSLSSNRFTVEYRASIIDKQYSMWAKETYNSYSNRVRMDLVKDGLYQSLLLDYTNNTYIFFKYNDVERTSYNCQISQLDQVQSDNFDMFGFTRINGPGSSLHVVTAKRVLQFAENMGYVYIESTNIDGVPVDHWQSCLTWKDVNAVFTVDYYFTSSSFTPVYSSSNAQIPVRAEVKGTMTVSGNKKNIHHIYDFIDYEPWNYLSDTEAFSLPPYMTCNGVHSVWNKKFPKLADTYSYTMETVSKVLNSDNRYDTSVDVKTVYHDAKKQMVREDRGDTTSLCDFTVGVEFLIQSNDCSARPIDPANVPSAVKEGDVIKMRDNPEILYMKEDLTYSGTVKFRDITADAFSGYTKKTDGQPMEVYVNPSMKTPMGLKIFDSKSSSTTYYNIFSYTDSQSYAAEDPFNILRCANGNDIINFHMTLIRGDKKWFDTRRSSALQEVLRYKTAELGGVSPLQIKNIDLIKDSVLDEYHWYFSYAKLDMAGAKSLVLEPFIFGNNVLRNVDNGNFEVDFDIGYSVFKFMITKLEDALTNNEIKQDTDNWQKSFYKMSDSCRRNSGDSVVSSFQQSVNFCARECLKSKMGCESFQYTPATKLCQIGHSMNEETVRTPGCNAYFTAPARHFDIFPDTMLSSDGVVSKKLDTIDGCARYCLDQKSFQCESFDTCGDLSMKQSGGITCILHKTHYYEEGSSPVKAKDKCHHFSRRYFDDYHAKYNTEMVLTGQEAMTVSRPDECAYLCKTFEKGCATFSLCYVDGDRDRVKCNLLPIEKKNKATYVTNTMCQTFTEKGIVSQQMAQAIGENGAGGYSGGAMFGLAIAMILTGVGAGILTVFLLRHFQIWEGFH